MEIIAIHSKGCNRLPGYPIAGRDTAKSGMGYVINRHLNDLVESIIMNVGGPYVEGVVPDEAHGRRSRHSSQSAGKPRTWRRAAGE
jgi:hypothetical protein